MPTIHVAFIDAETGDVFGEVDAPIERLPDTFEISTTMHLGADDWSVERAEPATRAEFEASGQLRLTLRRVVYMDPKSILFSMPTIENALPPGHEADDTDAFRLRPDEWRQVELVAPKFEPEAAVELAEIRVVREERDGPGFARIHVRERIPAPLEGTAIQASELAGAHRLLAVHDHPGSLVTGGFAVAIGDVTVYGREVDGRVVELGVDGAAPDALLALADRHGLLVVDWCAARMRYPRR